MTGQWQEISVFDGAHLVGGVVILMILSKSLSFLEILHKTYVL
jgi:hypothetical protein